MMERERIQASRLWSCVMKYGARRSAILLFRKRKRPDSTKSSHHVRLGEWEGCVTGPIVFKVKEIAPAKPGLKVLSAEEFHRRKEKWRS